MELPEDIQQETGVTFDMNVKKKILGENAARLYNIDIPNQQKKLMNCPLTKLLTKQRETV